MFLFIYLFIHLLYAKAPALKLPESNKSYPVTMQYKTLHLSTPAQQYVSAFDHRFRFAFLHPFLCCTQS